MRNSLNKKIVAVFAATALTLGAAACGQQKSPEEQKSAKQSQAAEEATKLPNTAWVRAEEDKVKEGGKLTLRLSSLPGTWNYDHADGPNVDLAAVRDPQGIQGNYLIGDEGGKVTFNPDYIESAELTSEDPQIVTVKYNKNAKWEDGTPITINDLIAAQKALNGENKEYEIASSTGWEDIGEIKQTDDEFTGEIHFKKVYADWVTVIFPGAPASLYSDPKTFNEAYVAKNTPSAGPYKVESIDQNGGVITLKRNEMWWGKPGKLDTIIFKALNQEQTPQSFANGEIDSLEVNTQDEYQTAKGRQDANIQKTNGLSWSHVTINGSKGPLADREVRKAIAYAINREAIAQAVIGGLEAPITLVNNMVFMPGQDGYEDSYGGELKYDPEMAKKILDDAGYAEADGVRAKDGEQLTFKITVPAGTKSNETRAQQIMKDLNAVGMKVELQSVPSDKYFTDYVNKKNFDMVTFGWQGTLFPMSSAGNIFVDSGQNYTGVVNPDVVKLNDEIMAELDQAKRIDIAKEMSQKALGEYSVVPFYATPTIYAVKNGLANYGAKQFESIDWTKVGWTE